MAKKIRYSFSEIEKNKADSGWHIKAIPNGYAATEHVYFDSEQEANDWLETRSSSWLVILEADRNRPRDPNQLAKMVVDISSGELPESQKSPPTKGRAGGLVGGKQRSIILNSETRTEIAKKAAQTRWGKDRPVRGKKEPV